MCTSQSKRAHLFLEEGDDTLLLVPHSKVKRSLPILTTLRTRHSPIEDRDGSTHLGLGVEVGAVLEEEGAQRGVAAGSSVVERGGASLTGVHSSYATPAQCVFF